MLSEKDIKLIKRFCLYSKLMLGGFISMITYAVVMIVINIINSFKDYRSPVEEIVNFHSMWLMMFLGVIGIIGFTGVMIIAKGSDYKRLLDGTVEEFDAVSESRKVRAAGTGVIVGKGMKRYGSGTAAEFGEILSDVSTAITFGLIVYMAINAERCAKDIADRYGIEIWTYESITKYIIAIPILLLIGFEIPHCYIGHNNLVNEMQQAKSYMETIIYTSKNNGADSCRIFNIDRRKTDYELNAYWCSNTDYEHKMFVDLDTATFNVKTLTLEFEFPGTDDINDSYALFEKEFNEMISSYIAAEYVFYDENMENGLTIPKGFKEHFLNKQADEYDYIFSDNARVNIELEDNVNYEGVETIKVRYCIYNF